MSEHDSDYEEAVAAHYKMEAEKRRSIRRVEKILRSHDIEMSVSACGCCESPLIRFVYQGEEIANTEMIELDTSYPPESDE